jgi:dihydrofolate reductase
MRTLIVMINSTANDIVSGPAGDEGSLVWADADNIEDLSGMLLASMADVDTILLGRITYEFFIKQWPLVEEWPDVSDVVLALGEKINTTPKIVVSGHPIQGLTWGRFEAPTELTGTDVLTRIEELKSRDGGAVMTFGSLTLVQALTDANLVDEYHLSVYPVVMHEGRHLFENLSARVDLELISAETSAHGAMLVKYAVAEARAARPDPMP